MGFGVASGVGRANAFSKSHGEVESDESTACFDPEFTSTDLRDVGIDDFDEDDPSEEWLAQSFSGNYLHTPNGPLGSDNRDLQSSSQNNSALNSPSILGMTNGNGTNGGSGSSSKSGSTANGSEKPERPGLEINTGRKKRAEPQGSPISNSVQENFRGFSFSGESFIEGRMMMREGEEEGEEDALDERDPSTEDDFEDDRPAGRVSGRRNGDAFADF